MKRGIIGVPESESGRLTTVEAYHTTKKEYGQELTAAIAPSEQRRLDGGAAFVEGTALKEEIEDQDYWYFDEENETIRKSQKKTDVQNRADFVAVPATDGQDGFAMVSSSAGEFAFDVIGRADFVVMNRAEILLGDFYLDREDDFSIATGGGPGEQLNTKFMAWGDNVEEDDDLGRNIRQAARANTLPQLAGTYPWDGRFVYANIAASGYVEVYEPDFSTYEFLDFVRREIMPYVERRESDDSEKSAEDDPNQASLDDVDDGDSDS